MQTGTNELIRDINQKLVLKKIIEEGPVSRASIARSLGITKATISAIVKVLLEQKLIEEIGSKNTDKGRKPILLRFSGASALCLSIDLAVDFINVMLSDLSGSPVFTRRYPNQVSRDEVIPSLITICAAAMKEAPEAFYGIVGISIGIHGIVWKGAITFTPYYPYDHLDIAAGLTNAFHLPVYIENEANLSVLAERIFCYHCKNIAGLSIHSGAGLGIIIDDQLYYGHNGFAGEFGHTIIEIDGRPCPCGNRGCLEQYVSQLALLRELAAKKGKRCITMEEFLDLYGQKDPDAYMILDEFVSYMAIGINNILFMYNPDIIVINSEFTMYVPGIMKRMEAALTSSLHKHCRLVSSSLRDISILLGGVARCTLEFLSMDSLKLRTPFYEPVTKSTACQTTSYHDGL